MSVRTKTAVMKIQPVIIQSDLILVLVQLNIPVMAFTAAVTTAV